MNLNQYSVSRIAGVMHSNPSFLKVSLSNEFQKVKRIFGRAICDVPLFWEKGGGRKRDGA